MERKNKCISGKNSYETEKEAQKAADFGTQVRGVSYLKPYFCMICYEYHLTSSDRKEKRKSRKKW